MFLPNRNAESPAPWCAAGEEGPGGGTAGTVALQAELGLGEDGWNLGGRVNKAVEVRMQALRRKKPDQGRWLPSKTGSLP